MPWNLEQLASSNACYSRNERILYALSEHSIRLDSRRMTGEFNCLFFISAVLPSNDVIFLVTVMCCSNARGKQRPNRLHIIERPSNFRTSACDLKI